MKKLRREGILYTVCLQNTPSNISELRAGLPPIFFLESLSGVKRECPFFSTKQKCHRKAQPPYKVFSTVNFT